MDPPIDDSLLDYEKQIFLDCFHEDGLLVMARGLGLERIVLNFLRIYSDPGQLVLILNSTAGEEQYYINQLRQLKITPLPKIVNNEIGTQGRYSTYLQGGVLFLSSRILVVDLLSDRVPVSHITGILVTRAHKVLDSSQEAFILRLYRQKNTTGFIKAFTDQPYAFTQGFGRVERVMKNLFVRKLFLWPRFEASVMETFNKCKPEVIEMQLKLTPKMRDIQMAILDLIAVCVKEVRKCNPNLDTDEITVENAMSLSFEKIISLHLDPVWHHLSQKTKQLIADLKVFRSLLSYLTSYDCLTFYNFVLRMRARAAPSNSASSWLFLEPAEKLFVISQQRVFNSNKETSKIDLKKMEENPKWNALKEIIAEIKAQNELLYNTEVGPGRTVVFTADEHCCMQLLTLISVGMEKVVETAMEMKAIADAELTLDLVVDNPPNSKKRRADVDPDQITLTQMTRPLRNDDQPIRSVTPPPDDGQSWDLKSETILWSEIAAVELMSPSAIIFHPLHSLSDRAFEIIQFLHRYQPRYIVLYDLEMSVVRQIEIHKATHPEVPLRVYFVMYTSSVEEQRYLTTLRLEKQAFEHLIKEKAIMALPEDMTADLYRDVAFAEQSNSRKGGLIAPNITETPRVIVDMREFRSELPSLIHRRGIDIFPVTLEVGDYILTPEICVERKSVNDLIGSLSSGRLFNQASQMTRFYKKPVLLIEFDQNKSFSLRGNYAKEAALKEVANKLVLLTLHFPMLKLFWCSSPYATAELFQELKHSRAEPDPTKAAMISSAEEATAITERFNQGPKELLLKLPGVNSKNYARILNRVESIAVLCDLSQEELIKVMECTDSAVTLYKFLHSDYEEKLEDEERGKPRGSKYRFGKRIGKS